MFPVPTTYPGKYTCIHSVVTNTTQCLLCFWLSLKLKARILVKYGYTCICHETTQFSCTNLCPPPFPTPQSMPHFMLVALAITTENGGYMQFKVTLILQALYIM